MTAWVTRTRPVGQMIDDSADSHADDSSLYIGDSTKILWARIYIDLQQNCDNDRWGLKV